MDKLKKGMVEIEYEKMIIDIPKNTRGVSVTVIAEKLDRNLNMSTNIYDTQDIIKRKIEI